MLKITVNGPEFYNQETEEFEYPQSFEVELEHSLASVSKWESIHEKPFLDNDAKTREERLSYVQCMSFSREISPEELLVLGSEEMDRIGAYIESKQTATRFAEMPKKPGPIKIITAEVIYYWMVSFNIPFECEHWHLNRLLTLIRVCGSETAKHKPASKSEKRDAMKRMRELNEQRKAQLGTRG